MPTGYTAKLMNKGQSFDEFVWTCARAFGALVTMREDSLDTPIPDEFKPRCSYHEEALIKSREKYRELLEMCWDEIKDWAEIEKSNLIKYDEDYIRNSEQENKRLADMRVLVCSWDPPSEDHASLKNFMLDQIKISTMDLSFTYDRLKVLKSRTLTDLYNEAVEEATRSIEYHKSESLKEIERARSHNQWIKTLRDSLGEAA